MVVKCCEHSSTYIFDRSFFILYVTRTAMRSRMSSKFGKIRPWTAELAVLDTLHVCRY